MNDIPKVKCHGPCGIEKEVFQFTPHQVTRKSPWCRMCDNERQKKRYEMRFTPAGKFNRSFGKGLL